MDPTFLSDFASSQVKSHAKSLTQRRKGKEYTFVMYRKFLCVLATLRAAK